FSEGSKGQWGRDKAHWVTLGKEAHMFRNPIIWYKAVWLWPQKRDWDPLPKATQKTPLRNSTVRCKPVWHRSKVLHYDSV
ncbi:hypothetical protein, partial [Sphingobacterium ginsenosidimutans]